MDSTLQAAQQQLLSAVHALQTHLTDASCSEQIVCVSGSATALLQHQSELLQALENKSIAERALRNVVASKEAEAARLRGEIQRLRNSSSLHDNPSSSQNAQKQQQQALQDASDQDTDPADPAERQAVLEAAVAAKDKPSALLHQLQSEVSACRTRIAALEAELQAATADHNTRLAQQQKAFLTKLEQLRQVHNQQVAAAIREAQKQLEQHNQRNKQLEEQLAQQQEALTALRQQQPQQQPAHSKKPPPPCPVQSAASDASAAPDTAPPAAAPGTQAPAAQDHPAGTATAAAAAPSKAQQSKAEAKAAAAAEVAALRDMEAQLVRLSGIVKSYQGEREQLRQALMAGCAERQALQQQVRELTAKLQAGQGSCKQPGLEGGTQQQVELSRAYWGSLAAPM